MSAISLKDIEGAISAVDYPATKDDILDSAQQQGAQEEVLAALRSLPPVPYRNGDEVIRSVDAEVGGGRVESRDADPDNATGADRVADRLR